MPFSSMRQMRYMFASHPRIARKMANRMKTRGVKFPRGKVKPKIKPRRKKK